MSRLGSNRAASVTDGWEHNVDSVSTYTDTQNDSSYRSMMRRRRITMASLVVLTIAVVVAGLARILGADGFTWVEAIMLVLFAANTPWIVLGFWNSAIGLYVLHLAEGGISRVVPLNMPSAKLPISARTAIIMPVFDEDPERVFRHLQTVVDTMDATGEAVDFEVFLLSDSRNPEIAAEEEARFAALQQRDAMPGRLHYRRRPENTGHKVGNIKDFCDRWGDEFDFMVVLDADSVMAGRSIIRLIRIMEHNPSLGILQTLPVGLPSSSPFARIFQFGMRQGMRPYTVGSAWWQGDEGPYWGHNAILRVQPFRAHCQLPILPGKPPFGGEILSHDQVEAVLMRRAGYHVRVVPQEGGSYEENPPTLPDFLKRDLRWCQGNLQHTKLLGMPGLRPLGRLQLVLGILMYLAAPLWMGFLLTGLVITVVTALDIGAPAEIFSPAPGLFWGTVGFADMVGLFVFMMFMTFAPKLFGVLDVMLQPRRRREYGGAGRMAAGAGVEILFSVLLAPVVSLAQTIFIFGLFLGKRVQWDAQSRDRRSIAMLEAARGLWPQTLMGLTIAAVFIVFAPSILPWAVPLVTGLILSVPFACLTSRSQIGLILARLGLCSTPEEIAPPTVVRMLRLKLPTPDLADAAGSTIKASAIKPLDKPLPVRIRSGSRLG